MGNENKNEHSVPAQNPEQAALMTAAISAAVAEAVKAAVTQMAQSNQDTLIAALRAAKEPHVSEEDAKKKLREIRESLLWKEDEAENRRIMQAAKDNCPHIDSNGRPSISLVHNYPDHSVRGICVKCHDLIHPREWRIGAPDAEHPRGKAYLVPEHKDYKTVRLLESHS